MLLQTFPASPPQISRARVLPPNEWITHEALMPRPPADSRVELMYARSSNASRSTLITRSIVGLIVSVTIKFKVYPATPAISL